MAETDEQGAGADAIAARLQRGDSDALAELIDRYHDPLSAFLYRMLDGQRDVAAELAQETFVRVLHNIHRYDPRRPLRPWLYAIAANLARDHLARADTRRVIALPDADAAGLPVTAPPEADLLAAEAAAEVRAALAALSPEQRVVVLLFYYHDLPQTEIAAALNIPLGTVKSRLFNAVRRLRKALEDPQ